MWLGVAPRMCLKEIKLHTQNMLAIISSTINHNFIKGGGREGEENIHDHLMSMRISTLTKRRYSYEVHKVRGKWLWPQVGFANHLALR